MADCTEDDNKADDGRSEIRELMDSGDFDLDRISALEHKLNLLNERLNQHEVSMVELERALELYLGTKILGIRRPLWAKERERIFGKK